NGVGDACDQVTDTDSDGIADLSDNCLTTPNPDQSDVDSDGNGDACDDDMDADGYANGSDNCPNVYNTDQADADGDGIGNACDPVCNNNPVTITSVTPDLSSPRTAGTTVVMTANLTNPDKCGTYLYSFALKGPGTGNVYVSKQVYGPSSQWNWITATADRGTNYVKVSIKDGVTGTVVTKVSNAYVVQ
ncbi:MAG: thrombospondin type 3 repeat-containing protein, partial [Nitrospirae bacterium]|nr:thrombospondin type 3 repeat-containing protein [Nitrospirota bacterium]